MSTVVTTARSTRSPTDQWLVGLAARASTLDERIAGEVDLTPADPETTCRRLEAWREAVARGDDATFDDRLALDGLDRAAAGLLVGHAIPRSDAVVPGWARVVAHAIGLRGDITSLSDDPALRDHDPIPAQELALPFLRAARAERDRRMSPSWVPPAAAKIGEERHLLRRLSELLESFWDRELTIMRDQQFGRLQEVALRARGHVGREHHDRLAWSMLRDLPDLLDRYPALARQLGMRCTQWATATTEFWQRLSTDRSILVEQLADGVDPGPVVEAEWGRSDPHRSGRSVVLVRFASGLGVVYKPKSLAAELALGELIEWLDGRGFRPRLGSLRVVDRGDFGWVERVEPQPVPDRAAAERYYERAGGLLALMRALDGSDCHRENVVAAGEHPHLVDAETVLQPRVRPAGGEGTDDAGLAAQRQIGEGVLGVGLLPAWFTRTGAHEAVDVSGLGRLSDGGTFGPQPTWEALGTDLARRVIEDWPRGRAPHELVLEGTAVRCEDHEEALVRGYGRAHDLLVAGRDDLRGGDRPLRRMATATVRVLLRGTWLYGRSLEAAQRPERLGDGIDRSLYFERLARALLGEPDPAARWPAFTSERRALEAGDVPLFEVRADATELPLAGRALPLDGSALSNAAEQLDLLDDQDLARQTAFIRASLAIRRRSPTTAANGTTAADPVAAAVHVGELLREAAIHGPDGSVTWVGAFHDPTSGRISLCPAGPDLYEGLPGIGLFLSALACVDGPRWQPLARAALRTACTPYERGRSVAGIGGSAGAGGLVHALASCARLLDDDALLDRARAVADAITRRDVTTDTALDLLGGSAGGVLGLLALYDAAGGAPIRQRACWAGDHLVRSLEAAPEGGGAWRRLPGEGLQVGMAHGASGGALALARLAAVTGERRFAHAARQALRFEHANRADSGGWFDLRADAGPRRPSGARWCWGSAGIGLARLGILRSGGLADLAPQLEADVAHAASDAASAWPELDHLCCGAAGVAEFARALEDRCPAELRHRADEWARRTAGRLVAGQPVRLAGPSLGPLPYLGLYQGVAGVAYALLAMGDRQLPNPVAWS